MRNQLWESEKEEERRRKRQQDEEDERQRLLDEEEEKERDKLKYAFIAFNYVESLFSHKLKTNM